MANFGADLGGLASGFLGGMGAVENIQMSRERLEAEKIKVREAKKQEEYLNSPAPNIKMSNFYNSFEPAQQQILDSTLARHGFKKGMTNRDFMNVMASIGLENKVYSELTAMGETSALLKIQKLHEKLNKTEDPNEKVKIQNEINQTKKAYRDSNAKILDLQSKFIGQIPKMNATFASKKPVEKDGELYQTQIVEDPDNPGSYKIQDVWVGTAKAKEPTSIEAGLMSDDPQVRGKAEKAAEFKERLKKKYEKGETLKPADIKAGFQMDMDAIKAQIMVELKSSEDRSTLAPMNDIQSLTAILLSGKLGTMDRGKAQQYIRKIRDTNAYWSNEMNRVLGRKGGVAPRGTPESTPAEGRLIPDGKGGYIYR